MTNALTTSATGMVAQQMNLEVISNNLSNVNTTGFKSQRAEFQDLMYQTMSGSGSQTGANSSLPITVQIGLGSKFSANSTNFSQGALQQTGNPTDVAVNGAGFFRIQKPDSTFAYTRDGSFKTDGTGQLVTSDGYPLDPAISIPKGASALTISGDGAVSAIAAGSNDPQKLGDIKLYMFTNTGGLTRIGQNLYTAGGASGDAQEVTPGLEGSGTLSSAFIEGSNVAVVEEMVRMISTQRAYEINSKAIQTADDMLGTVNNLKR